MPNLLEVIRGKKRHNLAPDVAIARQEKQEKRACQAMVIPKINERDPDILAWRAGIKIEQNTQLVLLIEELWEYVSQRKLAFTRQQEKFIPRLEHDQTSYSALQIRNVAQSLREGFTTFLCHTTHDWEEQKKFQQLQSRPDFGYQRVDQLQVTLHNLGYTFSETAGQRMLEGIIVETNLAWGVLEILPQLIERQTGLRCSDGEVTQEMVRGVMQNIKKFLLHFSSGNFEIVPELIEFLAGGIDPFENFPGLLVEHFELVIKDKVLTPQMTESLSAAELRIAPDSFTQFLEEQQLDPNQAPDFVSETTGCPAMFAQTRIEHARTRKEVFLQFCKKVVHGFLGIKHKEKKQNVIVAYLDWIFEVAEEQYLPLFPKKKDSLSAL